MTKLEFWETLPSGSIKTVGTELERKFKAASLDTVFNGYAVVPLSDEQRGIFTESCNATREKAGLNTCNRAEYYQMREVASAIAEAHPAFEGTYGTAKDVCQKAGLSPSTLSFNGGHLEICATKGKFLKLAEVNPDFFERFVIYRLRPDERRRKKATEIIKPSSGSTETLELV